jgi:hypothetical protein
MAKLREVLGAGGDGLRCQVGRTSAVAEREQQRERVQAAAVQVAERRSQQLRLGASAGRIGLVLRCLHRLLCRVCGLVPFGAEVYPNEGGVGTVDIWRNT